MLRRPFALNSQANSPFAGAAINSVGKGTLSACSIVNGTGFSECRAAPKLTELTIMTLNATTQNARRKRIIVDPLENGSRCYAGGQSQRKADTKALIVSHV
jgi:hypothetical protein